MWIGELIGIERSINRVISVCLQLLVEERGDILELNVTRHIRLSDRLQQQEGEGACCFHLLVMAHVIDKPVAIALHAKRADF